MWEASGEISSNVSAEDATVLGFSSVGNNCTQPARSTRGFLKKENRCFIFTDFSFYCDTENCIADSNIILIRHLKWPKTN